MKRIIAVLLLLCMTLTVMASCKKEEDADDTYTSTISEELNDGLPDVDMGGFEFNILGYNSEWFSWAEVNVAPNSDEAMGNMLYEEMYKRNVYLEERFGFFFNVTTQKNIGQTDIEKLALGGDTTYDMVMYYDKWSMSSAQYFRDWHQCEYIDLSQDYWNPSITKNFEYNGKQFAISGNFSLSMLSRTDVMLFNKEMFNNYHGDVQAIYDMVNEDKWTLEEMYKYAAAVVDDDNGKAGENGQYGITGSKKEYYMAMMVGSDIDFTKTSKDGTVVFTLPTDASAKDKIEKIMEYNENNNIHYDSSDNIDEHAPEKMFENGKALFSVKNIFFIPSVRAGMEIEFGILPVPKYDIDQEDYINACGGGDVACLLATVPESDLENIGLIMEAWSFHSQHNLVPLYQEELIKTRYSSDLQSYDMLTLVFNTSYAHGGLGSINTDPIMRQLVTDYFVKDGTVELTSLLQRMNPTVKNKIKEITSGV